MKALMESLDAWAIRRDDRIGFVILIVVFLLFWLAVELADRQRRLEVEARRRRLGLERCGRGDHETTFHVDDSTKLLHETCRWCGISHCLGSVISSRAAHARDGQWFVG